MVRNRKKWRKARKICWYRAKYKAVSKILNSLFRGRRGWAISMRASYRKTKIAKPKNASSKLKLLFAKMRSLSFGISASSMTTSFDNQIRSFTGQLGGTNIWKNKYLPMPICSPFPESGQPPTPPRPISSLFKPASMLRCDRQRTGPGKGTIECKGRLIRDFVMRVRQGCQMG